jgi:hypothetical protein
MFARVLLGCVAVCVPVFAALAEEPKETKFKPVAVFHGSHSGVRSEAYNVVTTAPEWEKLWAKHRRVDPLFTETFQDLEIDFESHYVVAIFRGNWGYGCLITASKRGETIVIGFEDEILSTEGGFPGVKEDEKAKQRAIHERAKERAMARYVFVVLPKPVRTVVIEENIEFRRGKQPVWKERATFPAPKEKK